jgi:hypothetical protein
VLQTEAEKLGGNFGLVIVDTSPAFFEGDDENSRKQMGTHAALLRRIIDTIPGGPCVVANCHPPKNVTDDNLLPAGGGTFLNEIDGNLTSTRDDSVIELHWQGKFRGPEFAPMSFKLKTVTHPELKDSDGRLLPAIVCEYLSEQGQAEISATARKDEDAILDLVKANPTISLSQLAVLMEWYLYSGEPNKMKTKRCLHELVKAKLLRKTRDGWEVVPEKGKAK